MKNSSYLILQGCLEEYAKDKKGKLTSFLLKGEQDKLNEVKLQGSFSFQDFSLFPILDYVHYSWFIPTLNSYLKKEKALFISSLEGETQQKLKATFNTSTQELTNFSKSYFKEHLISSLLTEEDDYIPIKYLPPSPLKVLLTLSKQEIVELIDDLALFDLAIELKKIVNTQVLKKIESYLDDDQKKFLKSIIPYKETFNFPPADLHKAKDEESFKKRLHQRGLYRLAKGVCNHSDNFIWHLSHRLDIGRGLLLIKIASKKVSLTVSDSIIKNILKVRPL